MNLRHATSPPDPCCFTRPSHDTTGCLEYEDVFTPIVYTNSEPNAMSDSELATRAPESDLAEQSAIPGDSAVDQGAASLGVCHLVAEQT